MAGPQFPEGIAESRGPGVARPVWPNGQAYRPRRPAAFGHAHRPRRSRRCCSHSTCSRDVSPAQYAGRAGSWELGAGSGEAGAGGWELGTGRRELGAGSWELGTGSWPLGAEPAFVGARLESLATGGSGRPYRVGCTGSLSTSSEVKRHRARSALGWWTAREALEVLSTLECSPGTSWLGLYSWRASLKCGGQASRSFFPSLLTPGGKVHQPGIEPGSHRWQRCILPLDH